MKRRIIALLMATVCTTALFASCGDETSSPEAATPCETHVDANKDGLCDGCNKAVVVITEQLAPEKEQEVPMVVKPIPTEVKMSDYIGPKAEDAKVVLPADASIVDLENMTQSENNLYLFVETEEERDYDYRGGVHSDPVYDSWREIESRTVKVYDVSKPDEEAVVFEKTAPVKYNYYRWEDITSPTARRVFEYSEYLEEYSTYSVTFKDAYVKVVEATVETDEFDDSQTTYKTEYYTYAWELIATAEETSYVASDLGCGESNDGLYWEIVFEETVYTVDKETNKIVTIEGATADVFNYVSRPAFSAVVSDYGYVLWGNEIWVYDLTKWVSCVSHFVYPSYWNDAEIVLLDNGKVLVQYYKNLPDSAVSYDLLEGGSKYDLVQAIIDPVTGEASNAELGYKIDTNMFIDMDKYNDNAKNVVYLYPIEDKEINYEAGFEAVIDGELNILYAHKATLVGQQLNNLIYLGEDRYATQVSYGGVEVKVVVDGEGKEVVKIPNNARPVCGMMKVGTKYYNWDMSKVLLDVTPSETELYYEVEYTKNDYMILSQTTQDDPLTEEVNEYKVEYFYFNASLTTPVKITAETGSVIASVSADFDDYFVVVTNKAVIVDEVPTIVAEYNLYNANNQKVGTFESMPRRITEVLDGVYNVGFTNGSQILIK